MRLPDWARANGIHPKTAYRWWREGTLPVPARQINARVILVEEPKPDTEGRTAIYARVSSHDQKEDLERQSARIVEWAKEQEITVDTIISEIGSGVNGRRAKLKRILSDPSVTTIIVEHRDRLTRTNFEILESALKATGRQILIVEPDECEDDLVRDITEVLTSFCARLYGKRSASHRAARALAACENTHE